MGRSRGQLSQVLINGIIGDWLLPPGQFPVCGLCLPGAATLTGTSVSDVASHMVMISNIKFTNSRSSFHRCLL